MTENETEYINAVPYNPKQSNQDITISAESVKKDFFCKYWDRDYISQQIAKIKNVNHAMLMQFLWLSGVRITEAVSLQKQQIDFQNKVMTVKWLKSRKYNYRVVPMHQRLQDFLQIYTAPLKAEDRVFPITRQYAWQLCEKYMGGNPHRFRHSFAVNWLRCDGDLVTLHRILGHSKIQTTMEYLKIVPNDLHKELSKIQF
jgi:integrase